MFTIEFIVPYEKLVSVVQEAFAEHPKRNEIKFLVNQVGIDDVKQSNLSGDIFIARGLTASYLTRLRQNGSVVELPMSGYDILRAMTEGVTRFGAKHIAIIATANAVYGVDNFASSFLPAVRTYEIGPSDDLDTFIDRALADGADLIIGGDFISTRAIERNIPAVRIETGKESVRQAIDEAWRLFHLNVEERTRVQRLNALVEHVHEGIVSVDSGKRITICNQYAQELIGTPLDEIIGKPLSDILPALDTPDFSTLRSPAIGDFIEINGTRTAVNRVPVMVNDIFAAGIVTFQKLSQIQKIETRIRREANRKGLVANYDFSMVIGTSAATRKTIELAKGFAKVQANILLVGETGTGKELFAQSIHKISPRMNGPFVAINCAALPESLLESELFGYVGGAFTGAAKEGKMGMFELAHGGTIFLDEISEMSLQLQGRLLRVIEEREIMRLGHDTVLPVDIRIIAATNRNLEQDVGENRFRKDLFYRLDVLRLDIPPLRHRREDIVPLARHFLMLADAENRSVAHTIDESAHTLLQEHLWDGNVRQLRNICERLSVVVATQVVTAADVASCLGSATARAPQAAGQGDSSTLHTPPVSQRSPLYHTSPSSHTTGSEMPARERIVKALACCDGNRTRTAKMLGIDRTTLYRHMLKHGLV